jgi:ribosomal protein RSM22 (predicted rRNA methylase)
MTSALPPELRDRIDAYLARQAGSRRDGVLRISANYRCGGRSGGDFAAYVAARLPATFAAVSACLAAAGAAPRSLLDVGAGPGTASWAALERWPGIELTLADSNPAFLALAGELLGEVPHRAITADIRALGDVRAELVIAAYALAEIPAAERAVLIVEPGTPAGFARIKLARAALIEAGASIAAPCPHSGACPIVSPDWCHFAVRLPRSRAHLHAKAASVPFEDEPYSYVLATRDPEPATWSRILARPVESKVAVQLKLCTAQGIARRNVARREGALYKAAKKLRWGGRFQEV